MNTEAQPFHTTYVSMANHRASKNVTAMKIKWEESVSQTLSKASFLILLSMARTCSCGCLQVAMERNVGASAFTFSL